MRTETSEDSVHRRGGFSVRGDAETSEDQVHRRDGFSVCGESARGNDMAPRISVMMIEDNPGDARLIREMLSEPSGPRFDLLCCGRLSEAVTALAEGAFAVILLDLSLPDAQGLDTLARLQQHAHDQPIIILTGLDDEAVALSAVRLGAQDYLVKGQVDGIALRRVIRYAIERKHADEALFEERNLLRMLMDNLPDAIYFKDSQGRFTHVSRARARSLGLGDPALAIGKTDFDFFTEDHARRALADEQAVMRSAEPLINIEQRDTLLDGRVAWVSTSKLPLRDQRGRIVGTFGTSHDITERKRAEERIERQLAHLGALHDIDIAITGAADVRVVLGTVLKHAIGQLGVDAATILLLDANTLALEFAAGRGFFNSALKHTGLRLGSGYAGQAALEGSIIQVPDLLESPDGLARSTLLAAEGFVFYCAAPLKAKGHIIGVLEVFHRTPLHTDREWLEFLEALSTQAAIAVDNAQLFDRLERSNLQLSLAYDATIAGWSRALDLRDKQTEGHTQRVSEMTVRLARGVGIDEAALVHVWRGGLLHDMGKIGIPDAILLKPGQLNKDEWAIMRQHPQIAYDMLSPIVYLRPALDIPNYHHEKWDGTGYPHELKGEQIPLAARVFAVVDVWDALLSDRPYRPAWPREKALTYVREQSGKHFDPQAAAAFLAGMAYA